MTDQMQPDQLNADQLRGAPLRALPDHRPAFEELGRMVLGARPLVDVLHQVARLAASGIPSADQVSITLVEDDRTRTAAFTGDLAVSLDERQYDAGFGPCLDAAHAGGVVRVADTSSDLAYPGFAAAAARRGVRSVLAVGLPMPTRTLGALNLYRLTSDAPFDDDTETSATSFAAYAAVALANAAVLARSERQAVHLHKAMESRAVIDQAKGIIMSIAGCSADEAFRLLAKQSQDSNRKLRDLAGDIVASAERGERAWSRT